MNITSFNELKFYSGLIRPEENIIFVFGSNPEGRHGLGAAKTAREQFGAIYSQGEGLQGSSYALPTKDLRVKKNKSLRSISPEDIQKSIERLLAVAAAHPDKLFCIAYTNTSKPSLNGYTGQEMADMFKAAFNNIGIPPSQNIVFSETWKDYFVTPLHILEDWWRHNGLYDREQASGIPRDDDYLTTTDNWWNGLLHEEKEAVYAEFFNEN